MHQFFVVIAVTLLISLFYYIAGIYLKMITNIDEAMEQNKRLVNEAFRVTQLLRLD